MLKYRNLLLLPLCVLLCSVSCDNTRKTSDCDGVICTMMFAAVSTEVRNPDGSPAVLDRTETVSSSGKPITNSNTSPTAGMYTIIDDGYQKILANKTEQVTFRGYRAGALVVEQVYTVKADCCHVSKVDGPTLLTLK